MSMGGAQRSLTRIARALGRYYTVSIVVFNTDYKVSLTHSGNLISLDVRPGSSMIQKAWALAKRVARLRSIKRKLQPFAAISFLEGADYVNILSSQGERVILSVRGSKLHDENMQRYFFGFRKFLMRMLYRRADAIVPVAEGIGEELVNTLRLRVPVVVIPNFYNLDDLAGQAAQPLDAGFNDFFDNPVISTSGRLAREKGTEFILEAYAEARKEVRGLRIMFIGDGPSLEALVAKAAALSLTVNIGSDKPPSGDVWITGEQQNVFRYLKRSRLYMLNSSSEGFPNGLAEALACGVPAMSADCPYGPRELLAPGTQRVALREPEFAEFGVLMPMPSTAAVWAKVICAVVNDEKMAASYSRRGLERMSAFSEEHAVTKWRAVIDGAIS
jgi:glycosyltransferase involved in cell wall biosynthesis